jgi:hypothetical protein
VSDGDVKMTSSRWVGSRALALLPAAALLLCNCKSTSSDDAGTSKDGDAIANCPIGTDDLISDFLIDNGIFPADGRQGGWYVYGDTNGTFDPPKVDNAAYPIDMTTGNPNCSGPGSLRLKAAGFIGFGAAMGTDFKPRAPADGGALGPKGTYDASKYRGVAFWAKSAAPMKLVQVKFPDVNTDTEAPLHENPICILNPASAMNCSPYLVKLGESADAGTGDFAKYATAQINTTWKRFEILFADTKQDSTNPGFKPTPDKLDTTRLLGMAIQVNADFSTMPPTANNFELWIDDIQFIR